MSEEVGSIGRDFTMTRFWGGKARGAMYQLNGQLGRYIHLDKSELKELYKMIGEEIECQERRLKEKLLNG